MEYFETLFEGTIFRNKYEVFDKLIFAALSLIGNVNVVKELDESIEFEVHFKGKVSKVIIEYAEEFSVYKAESVIHLRIDYFLKKFNNKRYRISKKNFFSNLIRPRMFNRLFLIIKREFYDHCNSFSLLIKDLFVLILSFLDNYTILNLPCCCTFFKKFFDKNENWQKIYFKRYFSCEFNNEELNWKKAFLNKKKIEHIKQIGANDFIAHNLK